MSTRKQFPLRNSSNITPKVVNKMATPKNKLGSTKKTLSSSKLCSKSLSNTNSSGNNSGNVSHISAMSVTTAPAIDPHHSQKYMQHKLDMVYNKYLQNIYLKNWLSKMHKETENAFEEQLVCMEEIHQTVLEDVTEKEELLEDISHLKDIANKIQTLELLEKVTSAISDTNIIENIKKLNHNLHLVCDKLIFEDMKFISSNENYEELQMILQEISTILSEINVTNDEKFVDFVQHICEIKELATKLRKNKEVAIHYQRQINNLVLREASKELCKENKL